jgi:hypothetical protein
LGDHHILSNQNGNGNTGLCNHSHQNNYNNLALPANFPRNLSEEFSEAPTIRTGLSKSKFGENLAADTFKNNFNNNFLLRQQLGLSPSDEKFVQSGFTPSGSQISNLFQSVLNNNNKASTKQIDNSGEFFRSQPSLSSQLSSSPAVMQPSLEKPKREFPCDYRQLKKKPCQKHVKT